MARAMDYFVRAFTEAGLEPAPGPNAGDWMRRTGAVDIHTEVLSSPMGITANTVEEQRSTTAILCNAVNNFAKIGLREF